MLLLSAVIAGLLPASGAQAATHLITLQGSRFNPPEIQIAVGDTVRWTAMEHGHTVSASDYRFDFWPTKTLTPGESVEWTFTEDETFRYICRVHAPGMSGVITVGEGSPPPPPPPPITGESRRVPSEFPTVNAALAGIVPDSEIILEPGVYPPFVVNVDDVLIRGAEPNEVTSPGPAVVDGAVIDGSNLAKTGISIEADDVTLRNLHVVKVADRAIRVRGDDANLEFLHLQSGFFEGVEAVGAARTRISDTTIASSIGAVGIDASAPNGLLIQRTGITTAMIGIEVVGGGGVVVRDSSIAGSGSGITLRGTPGGPLIGAHVLRNTVTQTQNPIVPPATDLEIVTGAGVWTDGTWSVTVERNTFDKVLTYGVVSTGLQGPNLGTRIVGNVVSEAGIAEVGWDGIGTACTDSALTEPVWLTVSHSCGEPAIGIPYPKVSADLLAHAAVGTALREQLP